MTASDPRGSASDSDTQPVGLIPALLDHVVIAGPDLGALVEWFHGITGVHAAAGGAHPTGTANALVALTIGGERGPQYIELIGPDPDRADPALPETFGIAGLEAPSLRTYAVHPPNIERTVAHARDRGYDPGDVADLSRRTPRGELLEWRLARSATAAEGFPFLIDWGRTTQPGLTDIPAIELVAFVRRERDAAGHREAVDALGLGDGVAAVVTADDEEEPGYQLLVRREDGALVEL